MKKHILCLIILGIQCSTITYGQKLTTSEVNKLVAIWNNSLSEYVKLTLDKNNAHLDWDGKSKLLDLRSKYAIANDSISKDTITKKAKPSGMYSGPIFWKYIFKTTKNSTTSFRANKSGLLFLKFEFQQQDTIFIQSQLNAYSSVQRTTDSAPHSVEWLGDKYISVLLQPIHVNDTIRFRVNGITISGKFQRKDNWEINKNYTKGLRTNLKREFKQTFNELIFIKRNNEAYHVLN